MKICIVGAGATGGYLGAKLINSGYDVTLVARGLHLEAIKKNGLKIIENNNEIICFPKSTDSIEEIDKMDYVFITLKTYSISTIIKKVSKMFHENTVVITAYNGVPWWYFYNTLDKLNNYQIKCIDPDNIQWDTITPERVIGCVVYPATEIIQPGIINHIEGTRFSLGEPSGIKSERISILSKILFNSKLKAPIRQNIREEIWMKLIGNLVFNPMSVITEETLDILISKEENRKRAYSAMQEATLIMNELKIKMNVSIEQRIEGAAKVGAHKTSMLQDFEKGKKLELDSMIVAVKEIGDLVNIKTPTIDNILKEVQEKIKTK